MGQLLLPIFPVDTQMITLTLGVREYDGTVYYLHNGVPIFSHVSGDQKAFRKRTPDISIDNTSRFITARYRSKNVLKVVTGKLL